MSSVDIREVLKLQERKMSLRQIVSNDKFRYPTNDKNSDPGVKLNNC